MRILCNDKQNYIKNDDEYRCCQELAIENKSKKSHPKNRTVSLSYRSITSVKSVFYNTTIVWCIGIDINNYKLAR